MAKLQNMAYCMTRYLITSNFWTVSRLGLHSHILYFLFGIANIVIIG